MKKEEMIQKAYEIAVERYAAVGVDTEKVLKTMQDFHLSLHCWQADDVTGFEVQAGALSGGIQATGNYPGKARNIDELRADILKAASYIPGTHRLNLHEIYGDFQGKVVDRDQVEPEHFKSWIEWGKEHNMKLDFNSTSFSHPIFHAVYSDILASVMYPKIHDTRVTLRLTHFFGNGTTTFGMLNPELTNALIRIRQ